MASATAAPEPVLNPLSKPTGALEVEWAAKSAPAASRQGCVLCPRNRCHRIVFAAALVLIVAAVLAGLLVTFLMPRPPLAGYVPSAETLAVRAHVADNVRSVLRNASGTLGFP